MDPDANLAELLELAARILGDDELELNPDDAERMAELVEALDSWLTHGGFLPARWRGGRVVCRNRSTEGGNDGGA